MFLSKGRKCEKRGQESDVSEIGKKSGNDMLVPVKTAEIHFEHMNWKEKDRSEVMHVQSLAGPFFIFDPRFYFCCRSAFSQDSAQLDSQHSR